MTNFSNVHLVNNGLAILYKIEKIGGAVQYKQIITIWISCETNIYNWGDHQTVDDEQIPHEIRIVRFNNV